MCIGVYLKMQEAQQYSIAIDVQPASIIMRHKGSRSHLPKSGSRFSGDAS